MLLPDSFPAFNAGSASQKSTLLPFRVCIDKLPVSCSHCRFINHFDYSFCTNCGYPVHPNKERLALYNYRLQERINLQKRCFVKIAQARNALYLLAGFSMLGIFYLFSDWKETVIKGFVMVLLGLIYAGLGTWSLQKPFTSLLISLIVMLTFVAINTWAEITSLSSTLGAVYLFIIQLVLIYFLLQGVKGAFHADILEEEFKL
ncbi:MAG: zinc ribbon protein [Segetibacter sp.]|nr:zinc ribbon protein [Segetibacter sp.]